MRPLIERVGLSKSEIYRRIQAGTFPRPIARGGSHPRVFPTLGAPKGGHIHTEIQGAGSVVPTLKNRWEVRGKGVI
nr:AlpA family phage regulatory protein [Burkholderia ambifaria]